ncbi:PREDICTED: amyloid beta A4 precursor protein-binding family A member 3 [Ceratotherium simum simum]|uniref:Amyloid beta A4 precursor protein-binding family A member 3 n=1 Tax=Ceratotherium simum simum TaxID=73337 RepID=A0ABM1DI02_CERSS|nr:PREDICTED: amyloid beta A4 precursor protein-binding family A member 3 [Ceratotherium simum simum]
MEFLTASQPPPGPPAMDLEEPRDALSSQDPTPDCQWNPPLGHPSSLSQMELDGPSIQDLVQQFEALPGDLVGLSPEGPPCPLHIATGRGLAPQDVADAHGLLSAEAGRDDLLNLLRCEECSPSCSCSEEPLDPAPHLLQPPEAPEEDPGPPEWTEGASAERRGSRSPSSSPEPWLETVPLVAPAEPPASAQSPETLASCPALQEVPGPCDHEDLLDGVMFGAKYLGSTQLLSERSPPPSARRAQAQEAVERVQGEGAGRAPPERLRVPQAQLVAQAIGQAFAVAYSQFLRDSGIDPSRAGAPQSQAAGPGHLHNGDLDHFSNSDNCREVCIEKRRGEGLGVALVESGWGSLLPTAVIANLLHGGPAERSGALSIGDRLTAINGTSLVGLPLAACQAAVREVKSQTLVTLSIVHCPPVTTAIIRRLHAREQLGFCVEDGIICSLLRGGIAERGGVRVGHRIIEINGQSVVATPHARIIELLTEAHVEVHIKTMPAATYRLLTGQEQPVYL